MKDGAVDLPCPGRRSPVRPLAVVPVCQGCALWRRGAEFEAHQAPVAEHDGVRWVCARADAARAVRAAAPDEVSPPAVRASCAAGLPPVPCGAGGSSHPD